MEAALKNLSEAIRNRQWELDLSSFKSTTNEEWTTEACRDLTLALADSTPEEQRIRPEDWPERATDLATTGGITLKSSLVVATWLARAGHRVPKIATTGSRGTGTIDLLHHLGLNTDLMPSQLLSQVRELGLAFCDSTHLAPADGKLMKLRREQDCMKVQPLVIASILAKKVALGIRRFSVEVRAGAESKFGNYRATLDGARRLVEVAKALELEVLAVVTNGDLLGSHGTGAALLAHECLRHLKGYPEPEEGESGFLWDRSHRQALELFCLAHWWSGREAATPDRAWLRGQIAQWSTQLENAQELFWQVAAAQGSRLTAPPPLPQFSCEFSLDRPLWELNPKGLEGLADTGARLTWHKQKARLYAERDLCPVSEASELPGATLLGAFTSTGPLPLDENVLVASVGTAGGIVTEAVDRLFYDQQRVDRVVVIHTRHIKSLAESETVRLDLTPRCSEEFDSEEVQAVLADNTKELIHPMLPTQRPFGERLALESKTLEFEDLYDRDANQRAFDRILQVLHQEDQHRKCLPSKGELWVLAAGGRKTMSALTYFAAMLFKTTATYHVLLAKGVPERAYYHVPPDKVVLVQMPELHLSNLVDLTYQKQVRRDTLDWSELVARADKKLGELLEQNQRREKEARKARTSLEGLLRETVFLPPEMQVVLVGDTQGQLKEKLERQLGEHLVSVTPVPDLPSVVKACDVVVVCESELKPRLLNFALSTTLPILSLTPRDGAEKRQVDAFLLQRCHAYQWVDCDTLHGLEVALEKLLSGSGAERCEGDLHITGAPSETLPEALLRRLFAGRAESSLQVKAEGSGQSQARKLWVEADGKPRRYFVKVAPYQSCFQEFCNYRRHVNGRADNYSGRIEWFPARDGANSAIAYTEIGTGRTTARAQMPSKLQEIARSWKTIVLDRIKDFHGTPRTVKIDPTVIKKYLNPLLPADNCVFATGAELVEGLLYEVNPEKGELQLIKDGCRLNVSGLEPQTLHSLRLHLDRPLSIPCRPKQSWQDKLREEFERVLPGQSIDVDLNELWRVLLHCEMGVGVIHGDLNLDNVMLEWDNEGGLRQAWLIDFAMTREGPTDYDFAKLEIELWTQLGQVLLDQGHGTSAQAIIDEVYDGVRKSELKDFASLVKDTGQRSHKERPKVYNRLRAMYALNTLKFKNLSLTQKRFGALLFQRFIRS